MTACRNVRFVVAYRGSRFHGFAENPGVATIGGSLRAALEKVLREPIALTAAGRTDAGVHASGQVVSFRTTSERFDPGRLEQSLNRLCAPDIVVRDLLEVDSDFDARFSATARRYEYTLNVSPRSDPLRIGLEWHVGSELDVDAMNQAATAFCGDHDFTSFCRRPKDRPDASLMRHVSEAVWNREQDSRLVFTVSANAFCHQMVRSLVGFCVSVGRGLHRAEQVTEVLAARSREAGARVAPPEGLVLVDVSYDA